MTKKMRKKKKLNLLPGMVFAIPFRQGRWGVGLLMRHWIDRDTVGIAQMCGFDMEYDVCPTSLNIESLSADKAINFAFGSDLCLSNGTFPLLGIIPSFSPHLWPIPPLANAPPHKFVLPAKLGIGITVTDEHTGDDPHYYAPMPGPVELEDYMRLPPRKGLGDAAAFAVGLEVAVTSRHPYQYCAPFAGRFDVWSRVMRIILTEKPELRKSAWVWSEILSLPV